MRESSNNLACARFQEQLPELLSCGEDIGNHVHIRYCENCRAFLAELQAIADAAHQLFPLVGPPDDLWEHIEWAMKDEGPRAVSRWTN